MLVVTDMRIIISEPFSRKLINRLDMQFLTPLTIVPSQDDLGCSCWFLHASVMCGDDK